MSVLNITKENFEKEVVQSDIPVLVDFWAGWCGPCKMLSPVVDEFSETSDGVKVGKINVDEEPELAEKFGIMNIPTLLVFKDGKAVKKSVGVISLSAISELVN